MSLFRLAVLTTRGKWLFSNGLEKMVLWLMMCVKKNHQQSVMSMTEQYALMEEQILCWAR